MIYIIHRASSGHRHTQWEPKLRTSAVLFCLLAKALAAIGDPQEIRKEGGERYAHCPLRTQPAAFSKAIDLPE
jgi:hypothetical protein